MGTITYEHLVDLFLAEGDKSKEEIIEESRERFGFPDNKSTRALITIVLTSKEKTGFISKDNGRYHLLKRREGEREKYLELLNKAPQHYLEQRPWIAKLKTALEEVVN